MAIDYWRTRIRILKTEWGAGNWHDDEIAYAEAQLAEAKRAAEAQS